MKTALRCPMWLARRLTGRHVRYATLTPFASVRETYRPKTGWTR